MDKLKPTYDLTDIKRLVTEGACEMGVGAIAAAHSLGLSKTQAIESLLYLERKDFEKSTTENFNHRVWQDVYKKRINEHNVYIKLKIATTNGQLLVVTSFKKDTSARS